MYCSLYSTFRRTCKDIWRGVNFRRKFCSEKETRTEGISAVLPSRVPTTSKLPFVLSDVIFPGETVKITVFEPKYRVILERIWNDSHLQVAMVPKIKNKENEDIPFDVGTLVDILKKEDLPDGKIILVKGIKRFTILDREKEILGYWQGNIRFFEDKSEKDPSKLTKSISTMQQILIDGFGDPKYQEYRGLIENPDDPVQFSFWLSQFIECSFEKKLELLASKTVSARLGILLELLKDFRKDKTPQIEKKEKRKRTRK